MREVETSMVVYFCDGREGDEKGSRLTKGGEREVSVGEEVRRMRSRLRKEAAGQLASLNFYRKATKLTTYEGKEAGREGDVGENEKRTRSGGF